VVNVLGDSVQVANGVAEYEGQKYFVSNDGEMVVDKDRNIIGYIDGQEFKPLDEKHLQSLKEKGFIEGGE
jgi:hypothetical protein